MNWKVTFGVSVGIVLLSVLIAIRQRLCKKNAAYLTPYRIIFIGVFIGVYLALLPIYDELLENMAQTILITLFNTFQVFTINTDGGLIIDSIHKSGESIFSAYYIYVLILFVVAPMLTFTFILSLLQNVVPSLRYMLSTGKETYVFSHLNAFSYNIANDLREKKKDCVLIFAETDPQKSDSELIHNVKKLNAICFKKDILSIHLKKPRADHNVYLFAIDKDEENNTNIAIDICDSYSDREHTTLYVLAEDVTSQLLLENSKGWEMTVRRISETQLLINELLYDHGQELFKSADQLSAQPGKDTTIHAVIVGLGRYGKAFFKSLVWFCQMDGYDLVIDAYDKNTESLQLLKAQCPELLDEHNGKHTEGDAKYKINIHAGVDFETGAFYNEIAQLKDATYCFVALGSDDINIKMSIELRRAFERIGAKPIIKAVVFDNRKAELVENASTHDGLSYNISCVGRTSSLYRVDIAFNGKLEREALACHMRWGEEPDFWSYEYNYRSSIAAAIHRKVCIERKVYSEATDASKLDQDEKRRIEWLEHRRWSAYMRSEGYIYSGSLEKISRNNLAKMHNDLIDYDRLSTHEKEKNLRVAVGKNQ